MRLIPIYIFTIGFVFVVYGVITDELKFKLISLIFGSIGFLTIGFILYKKGEKANAILCSIPFVITVIILTVKLFT